MDLQSAEFPTSGVGPEVELLLGCARVRIDVGQTERVRALVRGGIDWGHLIQRAGAHGVMPLLYLSLNTVCPEAVPETPMGRLRNSFYANAGHNLFLADELLRILALFEGHGICAIPFKGPVLAASAYGNLSLRQFRDLDVMVRKQDVARARELLLSRGYRQLVSSVDYHHEFVHMSGAPCVEIHWDFASKYSVFPINLHRLWDRLETTTLCGSSVRIFSPADLLLILCIHGAKHLWERLGWVCDVAQIIDRGNTIAWEPLLDSTRVTGHERVLLLGLQLASNLAGVIVPPRVQQRMQSDPVVKKLAELTWRRLFRDNAEREEFYESWGFFMSLNDRPRDRFRRSLLYLRIATIPTQADRDFFPIPRQLAFFHYFVRPVRLIGKSVLKPSWIRSLLGQFMGQR